MITILGVKIDQLNRQQAANRLAFFSNLKNPQLIITVNPEIIIAAQKDEYLKDIINNSSLSTADGIGILWAARFKTLKVPQVILLKPIVVFLQWLGTIILIPVAPGYFRQPITERLSGSNFIWDIADFAARHKLKIFLLGGAPTVAERCALKLQTDINDLRIAGVHSGRAEEARETIEAINKSKADILLVAFGAPKQEKWLQENLTKTHCKIGVGLGGTFDFIAGVRKRAPAWLQKIGLEWLFRLIQEPSRIKRQLAIPKFMIMVLIDKLQHTVKN